MAAFQAHSSNENYLNTVQQENWPTFESDRGKKYDLQGAQRRRITLKPCLNTFEAG